MSEIELRAELDHHARVRSAMASMRRTTVELLGRYESDFVESRRNRRPGDARPDHNMGFAMTRHSSRRVGDLADRDAPLFSGRLWLESGEDYHLGRPGMQTYGHIVIDEAQDLSPMECRAIARRCPTGSLTVLGDLAQGTTPWAATDWKSQMGHLGRAEAAHTELTSGFRVPEVIIQIANRVLPHLGVSVSPARSVRSDGSVDVISCDDLLSGIVDAVEKALVNEGMVGVIAADATLERLRPVVPASDRLELVSARLAKGLEFDHVIVVDPADFAAASATGHDATRATPGLRYLYVALTRAVSRLTVVHTRPLPPELDQLAPR